MPCSPARPRSLRLLPHHGRHPMLQQHQQLTRSHCPPSTLATERHQRGDGISLDQWPKNEDRDIHQCVCGGGLTLHHPKPRGDLLWYMHAFNHFISFYLCRLSFKSCSYKPVEDLSCKLCRIEGISPDDMEEFNA